MKKALFLLFVLFLPFVVFASDIDDLELKWSLTEDVINYSAVYITDNKIIFQYNKSLFSYNKDGSVSGSKEFDNNFNVVEVDNNKLILLFYDELILIDENLNIIENFNVDGDINRHYLTDDSLILFSDLVIDSKDEFHFYRFDFELNILNEDTINLYGGSQIEFKDDKYIIKDYYTNEFYVDDNYKILPINPLKDGSYFVYFSNNFYKYDKNKNLIKTLNFEDSGKDQYGFEHYILNDKLYVASYSYIPAYWNDEYNCYTIHLYLVDYDLNILKENSIVRPDRALSSYNPSDYRYGFYLNNGSIYVYDGFALYQKYYKLDENLTLSDSSSQEAIPKNDDSLYEESVSTKIRNALYEIKNEDEDISNPDYFQKKDGSYVVSVRKGRVNNFDVYEYQNELVFMDEKFNITSNIVVNEWSVIDKTLYPDYAVDYPCISKRLTSYIEEYNNDYVLYVANTPVSSIIRIYDKNGNIVKDFSKDAKNIHMGPTYITIKDNAILIGMKENFYLYCPAGLNDTMGEVNSRDNVLAKQILYYDFPYDIFTKTDGNGDITVSEKTSFSGRSVEFVITPKEGYVLGEVKVTDANGNVVVFNDYKFTMPSADVTIEAIFVKIGANPDTSDVILGIIILMTITGSLLYLKNKKKIKWLS